MNSSSLVVDRIEAGAFGHWLAQAQAALRGRGGMDVPCGECVGCCTSNYSILLRPDDEALDIVPVSVLSSVPGMHYPHAKMNPRSDGTCPMFSSGRCAIYAQRPQTCLDYDCRVFAAAGMEAGDDKPVINRRIRAWVFSYENAAAQHAHQAIQSAARFIRQHADAFPQGWVPRTPAGIAVLALKVHEVFLEQSRMPDCIADQITAIVQASQRFDAV